MLFFLSVLVSHRPSGQTKKAAWRMGTRAGAAVCPAIYFVKQDWVVTGPTHQNPRCSTVRTYFTVHHVEICTQSPPMDFASGWYHCVCYSVLFSRLCMFFVGSWPSRKNALCTTSHHHCRSRLSFVKTSIASLLFVAEFGCCESASTRCIAPAFLLYLLYCYSSCTVT